MKTPIMTVSEAAKALGLSPSRIRQLEAQGELPALRSMTGRRIFWADDVRRLASERHPKLQEMEKNEPVT